MANLIITVISIALVAVAALMGAYYGGSAFMGGQAKAKANQLIEGAKQISAAAIFYSLDNNGQLDDGNPEENGFTFLIPKYLSNLPTNVEDNEYSFYPLKLSDGSYGNTDGMAYNLKIGTSQSLSLCNMIVEMARGSAATPKKRTQSDVNNFLPTAGSKFDCIWLPQGSNGAADFSATVPDGNDVYVFVYLIR